MVVLLEKCLMDTCLVSKNKVCDIFATTCVLNCVWLLYSWDHSDFPVGFLLKVTIMPSKKLAAEGKN